MYNNDFLNSFNLGIISHKLYITIKLNNKNKIICKSLYDNGFISSYHYNYINKTLILYFNQHYDNSLFYSIKQVSKPSRKRYISIHQLKHLRYNKKELFILSTSKGILSSIQALNYGIGGELLFILKS